MEPRYERPVPPAGALPSTTIGETPPAVALSRATPVALGGPAPGTMNVGAARVIETVWPAGTSAVWPLASRRRRVVAACRAIVLAVCWTSARRVEDGAAARWVPG